MSDGQDGIGLRTAAFPQLSLRERKKAKTRAAIQKEALRLFKERGYAATTVEQIAAAAEVSPSTFFRYFPTKEDVVIFDVTDAQMMDEFLAQPAEVKAAEALRRAIHTVYATQTPEEWARDIERQDLMRQVPELFARVSMQLVSSIDGVCQMLAERTGLAEDDVAVRAWGGALIGAVLSVYMSRGTTSGQKMLDLMDDVLAQLEHEMPF